MLNPRLAADVDFDPTTLPFDEIPIKDRDTREISGYAKYMRVAYRLIWFLHDNPPDGRFRIKTDVVTEAPLPYATAQVIDTEAPVYLTDNDGKILFILNDEGVPTPVPNPDRIIAGDRKYIVSSSFKGDPTEKAMTGAIGRVLARVGYGTEHAEELLNADDIYEPVDSPTKHHDIDASGEAGPNRLELQRITARMHDRQIGALLRVVRPDWKPGNTLTEDECGAVLENLRHRRNGRADANAS